MVLRSKFLPWFSTVLAGLFLAGLQGGGMPPENRTSADNPLIQLPTPSRTGGMTLAEALHRRRSVRQFTPQPLDTDQLGQLCWSAQGITHGAGMRTAPSAGALYPLELYLVTAQGLFHYQPVRHALRQLETKDLRRELCAAALLQESVHDAPAVFIIAAVYERTSGKYGAARTPRYVHMEVGHAAQNLLLQATALGLGAVPVGAFHDPQVQEVLKLPSDHRPLYLIPVGHPR